MLSSFVEIVPLVPGKKFSCGIGHVTSINIINFPFHVKKNFIQNWVKGTQ